MGDHPAGTRLFVGNLPYKTTTEELTTVFQGHVKVKSVNLIPRGRAFVEVQDESAANEVIKALNGSDIGGRPVKVEIARDQTPRERTDRPPRPPRPNNNNNTNNNNNNFRRNPRPAPQAAAPPAERRSVSGNEGPKLFVGNLPFRTTAQELGNIFKESNVNVKAVNIISRGRRSLGYGFVEVQDDSAANEAVKALNKKEIEGRQINVEVARPPSKERPPARPRPPFRPNQNRPPRPAPVKAEGGEAPVRNGDHQARRAPPRPRAQYSHSLFVANLPFKVGDNELKEIMSTPDAPATDARVARRFGRRSKGFGFVEYESDAARDDALKAFDQKEVDGRVLSVKVAHHEAEQPAPQ